MAPVTDPVAVARSLADLIDAEADATDRGGTLTTPVVAGLADAGLFGLLVPRALGGTEADAVTTLLVFEELSRADGSSGWSFLANATTSAFAAAYTGEAAVAAMFDGEDPVVHAGMLGPRGEAKQVDGGYLVSGRFSFGSGIGHATWVGAGTLVTKDGEFVAALSGLPEMRVVFVPRDRVELRDNWDVLGLSGTGSFDYELSEQFVDAAFTFPLTAEETQRGGPVYRLGVLTLTSIGHCGFALGVARRALEEITRIADTKTRMGASSPIGDQPRFQHDLVFHDAARRAARALAVEVFTDLQDTVDRGDDPTVEQAQRARQVTTYANAGRDRRGRLRLHVGGHRRAPPRPVAALLPRHPRRDPAHLRRPVHPHRRRPGGARQLPLSHPAPAIPRCGRVVGHDGSMSDDQLARLERTAGIDPVAAARFHDPAYEWRRLFAEAFGTFLLVIAAAGAPVVNASSHGRVSLSAQVVAPGLMVMAIIYFMGAIGGAHLNPAVTVAFSLRGNFPWRRVPGYLVVQLLGAAAAAGFLRWMFGNIGNLGATVPQPGIGGFKVMVLEALLTLGLVSVILGVASGARNVGVNVALAVGGYIALAGLWAAPITGASMNPARSFGPAVVGDHWNTFWAYVVGPLLGATVAVGAAWVLRGRSSRAADLAAQGDLGTSSAG